MRSSLRSSLVVLSLAVLSGVLGLARADRFPPDPVEELRQTLKTNFAIRDPAYLRRLDAAKDETERRKIEDDERDKVWAKRVAALHSIDDLRRALLLQEWPEDRGIGEEGPAIKNKTAIAKRFRTEIEQVLLHGTPVRQIAALNLLTESGTSTRTAREYAETTRSLAPELVKLVDREKNPAVRSAAARTLGLMYADPTVARPALAKLLASDNLQERRAAAGALPNMVRVVAQLNASSAGTTKLSADLKDIIAVTKAVAPLAGQGLADSDLQVRRLCAEAFEQGCAILASRAPQRLVNEETGPARETDVFSQVAAELPSLVKALADQIPALTKAAGDPDESVRINARSSLEQLASARKRIPRSPEIVTPPGPKGAQIRSFTNILVAIALQVPGGANQVPEQVERDLQKSVPTLIKGLSDADKKSRLAAVEALEALGSDAAPAIPDLIKVLNDKNVFVRWAAARTLGKIGPGQGNAAVAGIAKLLRDPDYDVCLAAATALERLGPNAKSAIPALIDATKASDALMRVAVTKSIDAIGTDAQSAIPALAALLSDPEARVRQAAATVLGHFGNIAITAEPALRKAVDDSEPEVRLAASDALLKVTQGK
jgi:HEAT repeat protein